MERRKLLKLISLGSLATLIPIGIHKGIQYAQSIMLFRIKKPISVYITWAAHDNISDNKPLTEKLVKKELNALLRLKKRGVQFDYFVLDEGWADPSSGCRKFDPNYWTNGYYSWLQSCKENHLLPGLWFPVNILGMGKLFWMNPLPEWENSICNNHYVSLSKGNFLEYHIATFQLWYNRGIRLFKLDFADFNVKTSDQINLNTDEIIEKNENALYNALVEFRKKNNEAVFLAYNGFGGEMKDTFPVFTKNVNNKWLDVFDSMYCGDPRPADVPCFNFWRSKELYSDHMVRQFEFNNIPLQRIDNSSFMIGNTGTCYYRQKQNWKGMLILSLARGGWINTYYGDISLLNDEDGKWFSKTQSLFYELLLIGNTSSFGPIPGIGNTYGYITQNGLDGFVTIVNPTQKINQVVIPNIQPDTSLILFSDGGYIPKINKNCVSIGSEQMIVIGFGKYASDNYQMGIQEDVNIPNKIQKVPFLNLSENPFCKIIQINELPSKGSIRIIFRQKELNGRPHRTKGEASPNGKSMAEYLTLEAYQSENEIPIIINYDKQIWSGLSWVVGEVQLELLNTKLPIEIHFSSIEPLSNLNISCSVLSVKYLN